MAADRTIEGLDPRFFRPCIFPVLRRLGRYTTSITVNNGVTEGPYVTDVVLSLSAFAESGQFLGTVDDLGTLRPGEIAKIATWPHLAALGAADDEDALGVIHVVPKGMVGAAADVDEAQLFAHVRASDDFIELHQSERGVVTGVAYQTGPLNDPRFGSTRTTVCQAPKVVATERVDTILVLLNVSTSLAYDRPVTMDHWVLGPDGSRVARAATTVPPWTFRTVNLTDVLAGAGRLDGFRAAGGLGTFLGYAKEGSLVPISLTHNHVSGAIACDHTLPPVFYLPTWGGERRLAANRRLEVELFDGAAATSATVPPVPAAP